MEGGMQLPGGRYGRGTQIQFGPANPVRLPASALSILMSQANRCMI